MKDMIDILVDSGKTTGGIMLIIGAATLFSYVCTVFGIAQAAQALLLEISGNKYIFLLIVNVIFLIAGCFVDANSAMYIFIPVSYTHLQLDRHGSSLQQSEFLIVSGIIIRDDWRKRNGGGKIFGFSLQAGRFLVY